MYVFSNAECASDVYYILMHIYCGAFVFRKEPCLFGKETSCMCAEGLDVKVQCIGRWMCMAMYVCVYRDIYICIYIYKYIYVNIYICIRV